MIPRVLVIAGSDSGGGAGIQADIKTVTMLGGHAITAITAITAQNTRGVQSVMPVPAEMVLAQMRSVLDDIGVDAVKIGMLGSAETAHAVADVLDEIEAPMVFDPVMVATSGDMLADAATIAAFGRLMGIATLTTPNLPEFEALERLHLLARDQGRLLLLKGGHSKGATITDRLIGPRGEIAIWTNPRIDTRHAHGTGCTLASAIATGLGSGLPLVDAVSRAIAFVRAALANAPALGAGHGPMGHALGTIPFDLVRNA
ncbi:bifunctional hydroxymethylpyrimidine kinase/phosphomethylpyrimidine kinase [uncultured Sphingomonas sp.]|uniref:bifunctional hydroxymethylpyrimidine kinase/phosphomethylpyrimidine kinase n=1 Tax=uncultured Sphingomonas sp. TaxID=158754 RepID=UPI0035CA1130